MADLGFLPSQAGPPTGGGKVLALVPDELAGGSLAQVDFRSQGKFRAVSPGQRRAVCPEIEPSIYETVFGDFPENYSRVTKWMPRGMAAVPTTNTAPVTVFSQRVPDGSRFWMEGISFNLAPAGREATFYWMLYVNGIDILNYGQPTQYPGRPVPAVGYVSLGQTRDQQPCVQPGSLIEFVVAYLTGAQSAGDMIQAAVIGSLEGVRP